MSRKSLSKPLTLGVATHIGNIIRRNLRINGNKVKSICVGSIRRQSPTVKDIDILVVHDNKCTPQVDISYDHKWTHIGIHTVLGHVWIDNVKYNVDIFFTSRKCYYCALFHHTGPKSYNIRIRKYAKDRGWKLNQYGLYRGNKMEKIKSERDITRILGTHYYQPQDRL